MNDMLLQAQRRRVAVINCSASTKTHPCYNLGSHKLFNWLKEQGHEVTYYDGDPGIWLEGSADLICLSVVFSWHAILARNIALRMKDQAEIWCGGPGMYALANWWKRETGLESVRGLDQRFEKQQGNYQMCFASRGCPVNCSFCLVPRIEGLSFTFLPEFRPAPILCDNNLSALPADYQTYIIERYRAFGQPLIDANSGFEPRYYDEGTFQRWRVLLDPTYAPWRFALDEVRELADVERMMQILRAVPAYRKRVYCLVGNEDARSCHERAQKIIEWGGEPHCQTILPLNWLGDPQKVKLRGDWQSYRQAQDFCRFYNRKLWRKLQIWDYQPRKHQPAPFAFLRPMT